MKEFDVNQIVFVTCNAEIYAVYNNVYYKINSSAKTVIEEMQNGAEIAEVETKFHISRIEIEKLIDNFKQKKKGSILGRLVLFPKLTCNNAGKILQYLMC